MKNLDRLVHIHFAICPPIRRVAQFTQTGMARAGIVPTVGRFLRPLVRHFEQLNTQVGIELFE